MGLAASLTDDPEDSQVFRGKLNLDFPSVIAVADQISASTAGAAKLVERNLVDELVVGRLMVPLGKLVAF